MHSKKTVGLLILASCFFYYLQAIAQVETTKAASQSSGLLEEASVPFTRLTEIRIGVYVLRMGNVSQKDGSFDVDFWIWFRWKGADVKPHESFELANGVIRDRFKTPVINDEGFNHVAVRVQATIFHEFNVSRFPLDDHVLKIEVEDTALEEARLRFIADDGIALDPGLSVAGWQVALGNAAIFSHVYPTNYGIRSSVTTSSTYSRFVVPVELKRAGMGVLFKQVWISLLAVVLGLLAFLVRSNDLDARFGLGIGSIFAASANAFAISTYLPNTTDVTLVEQINLIAIGTIFLCLFLSVASLRLRYAVRDAASDRLDMVALPTVLSLYVLANLWVLTPTEN